jgi:hypothetical protein
MRIELILMRCAGTKSVTFIQGGPPGYFIHTYFYNHARRLRLDKLLYRYLELSRSPSGYFFKPLLGPDGGFTSETAARRFQKRNGRYVTVLEVKRL